MSLTAAPKPSTSAIPRLERPNTPIGAMVAHVRGISMSLITATIASNKAGESLARGSYYDSRLGELRAICQIAQTIGIGPSAQAISDRMRSDWTRLSSRPDNPAAVESLKTSAKAAGKSSVGMHSDELAELFQALVKEGEELRQHDEKVHGACIHVIKHTAASLYKHLLSANYDVRKLEETLAIITGWDE